jgi:SAM-dependent methyltransferase
MDRLETSATPDARYAFGDNERASARLERLAEIYEPESRALLERSGIHNPDLAVDLGCGPGWSTKLLRETLTPKRTVGLDASPKFIAEARQRQSANLEFVIHDVACAPLPVSSVDVMFCRFLLTHLRSVQQVLTLWAEAAGRGGCLLLHETESLESDDPSLRRYYQLVEQLQQHYGQILYIGGALDACFAGTGWRLVESRRCVLEKQTCDMAELHLANLRTWRNDPFARRTFDWSEIDKLEKSLSGLAAARENSGVVFNAARQIIACREQ